jgi:hypothetical protein
LTERDRAEIREITAEIEAAAPDLHDSDRWAIEGMARSVWRARRMLEFLSQNGVTRDGEVRSLLKHVDSCERIVLSWAAALGLSPSSRFEMGLSHARARALTNRSFDLDRLPVEARARVTALVAELEQLVSEVEVVDDAA